MDFLPSNTFDITATGRAPRVAVRRLRAALVMSALFAALFTATWTGILFVVSVWQFFTSGSPMPWSLMVVMAPFVAGIGASTGIAFSLLFATLRSRKRALQTSTIVAVSTVSAVVVAIIMELWIPTSEPFVETALLVAKAAALGAGFGAVIAFVAGRGKKTAVVPQ